MAETRPPPSREGREAPWTEGDPAVRCPAALPLPRADEVPVTLRSVRGTPAFRPAALTLAPPGPPVATDRPPAPRVATVPDGIDWFQRARRVSLREKAVRVVR